MALVSLIVILGTRVVNVKMYNYIKNPVNMEHVFSSVTFNELIRP